MTSQGFSERIEQVHSDVVDLREKTNNLHKTVSTTKGQCEDQEIRSEEKINDFNQKLKLIMSEVRALLLSTF